VLLDCLGFHVVRLWRFSSDCIFPPVVITPLSSLTDFAAFPFLASPLFSGLPQTPPHTPPIPGGERTRREPSQHGGLGTPPLVPLFGLVWPRPPAWAPALIIPQSHLVVSPVRRFLCFFRRFFLVVSPSVGGHRLGVGNRAPLVRFTRPPFSPGHLTNQHFLALGGCPVCGSTHGFPAEDDAGSPPARESSPLSGSHC